MGEAKQDGAKGDLIRVTLSSSKKDIQAQVKAKGQVEIKAGA
jgi:flagella basal body P-ring formation protein FlgA